MFFSKVPLLHSAINASTFGETPFAELMNNLKDEEIETIKQKDKF